MRSWRVVTAFTAGLLTVGCVLVQNDIPGGDTTPDGDPSVPADGDDAASGRAISGNLGGSLSAKRAAQDAEPERFRVVVQANESMTVYETLTDENGDFRLDIPEDDESELFTIALVGPDGQPIGPVVFDTEGDEGYTGLELVGEAQLGELDVPNLAGDRPIRPGPGVDLGDSKHADDVIARLDEHGVPVGVLTFGRGDEAQGEASDNPRQMCDVDRDGMIDLFDADDDGDGKIDDMDPDHGHVPMPWEADGITLNFFMNLKIDAAQAEAYFEGDTAGINDSLRHDTVITFEVRGTDALVTNIESVRVLGPPHPAPPYLAGATLLGGGDLWAASDFALAKEGDAPNHFQQFVVPNAFIRTGDLFLVEVTFLDGTTKTYARMIHYVFKSIPKVIGVGAPDAVAAYDGPGTIAFDPNADLTVEWNPPVDDFGVLLTDLDYRIEVFYNGPDGQVHGIDGAATWPDAIEGWRTDTQTFEVAAAGLSLDERNAFSVTLPAELFVAQVETADGPVAISSYKIDVAAQNNGNNSALMLTLEPAP